jgi:hypothetical protein
MPRRQADGSLSALKISDLIAATGVAEDPTVGEINLKYRDVTRQ